MTHFGEMLKRIRIERGLTQDKLAEILGTSKQVVSRYEKGQRNPKLLTVEAYAKKLNMPLSSFVSEEATDYSHEHKVLIDELHLLTKEEIGTLLNFIYTFKKR